MCIKKCSNGWAVCGAIAYVLGVCRSYLSMIHYKEKIGIASDPFFRPMSEYFLWLPPLNIVMIPFHEFRVNTDLSKF